MPRKINRTLESTAYHEAGHAAMQFMFELKIEKATIVSGDEYLGVVSGQVATEDHSLDVDTSDEARQKAEKDAMVFLAGGIAQKRFDPKGYKHKSSERDIRFAMNVLSYFTGGVNEETEAYFRYLKIRTKNLVCGVYLWPVVQVIAKELLLRQTLTGEQIEKTIHKAFSPQNPSRA